MHLIFLIASRFVSTKHLWHQRTPMPRSDLGQRVYLLCDKLVVISNFILDQIHASIPSNRLSMIYNPIESHLASSNELLVRKELFSKKKHTLAFVANMAHRKRPGVFLELAKYLTKIHPNKYKFIMIGRVSSDIEEIVNRYKKCGALDDAFEIAGFQSNIEEYWSSIDFLISPAVNEGFGRTIVEAMRAGVVVIAYNSGGHSEIIQHKYNGYLVDKLDVKIFTSKIFLMENNLNRYMEILLNAHSDASLKYSVTKHTNKIVTLYYEMIGDR
jgi:glycosyltransferase involved in cell wall biosynthesis